MEQETQDEPVPVFGSWPRIYAAAILWAIVVMCLVGLFSSVSY